MKNDPEKYKIVRQEETEERIPLHLQHISKIKPNSHSYV